MLRQSLIHLEIINLHFKRTTPPTARITQTCACGSNKLQKTSKTKIFDFLGQRPTPQEYSRFNQNIFLEFRIENGAESKQFLPTSSGRLLKKKQIQILETVSTPDKS